MGNSATSEARSIHSGYLLANAAKEAPGRFAAFSALFDPGTIRHLEGLGVAPGWNCLEVGGGSGSIVSWLAERVGPTGRVLATDIDPRFLECLQLANLEVRRHDIATDPLPKAAFDLVHSRLVLLHVPEREKALARMIDALKPGGWLIDEEYDSVSMPPDPTLSPGEVLLQTQVAMMRLFDDRGVDRRYGRRLLAQLRTHALVSVGAEARVFVLQGGSQGASLLRATYEQLRDGMIGAHYITRQEFDADVARLDDPNFMMPSGILWAAWGQRP